MERELRGIKCDLPLKGKVSEEGCIEDQMQRKTKILRYYDKRNGISTASLGDKPYKNTTYASEFYKTPGLIPGSTNVLIKRNAARKKQIDFTIDKNAKWPMKPQKLWSEQVKKEAKHADLKQVLDANVWEETVLEDFKNKNAQPEKAGKPGQPIQAQPTAASAAKKK